MMNFLSVKIINFLKQLLIKLNQNTNKQSQVNKQKITKKRFNNLITKGLKNQNYLKI